MAAVTTLSDALARAASAARARELDDVLRHLLDAWRARPSRAIGAVIDRAPSHAPPSDIAGKLKRSEAAWLELAATRDARALPALLQTLCDVSAPDAEARLASNNGDLRRALR